MKDVDIGLRRADLPTRCTMSAGSRSLNIEAARTKPLIRSAVVMRLNTMRADGDPIPEPTITVDYVEVL